MDERLGYSTADVPATTRRTRPSVRHRVAWALGLAALWLGTPGAATAAQIHWTTEAQLGPNWNKFLAGGLTTWRKTPSPAFPSYLVLATSNGKLVETPFVDYLLWRRSLNPTRFDRVHPRVGPDLAALLPPTRTVPAASILKPPTTPTRPPVNPAPQLGVPEPGSLAAGLVLTAASLGWHARSRRRRIA